MHEVLICSLAEIIAQFNPQRLLPVAVFFAVIRCGKDLENRWLAIAPFKIRSPDQRAVGKNPRCDRHLQEKLNKTVSRV